MQNCFEAAPVEILFEYGRIQLQMKKQQEELEAIQNHYFL